VSKLARNKIYVSYMLSVTDLFNILCLQPVYMSLMLTACLYVQKSVFRGLIFSQSELFESFLNCTD